MATHSSASHSDAYERWKVKGYYENNGAHIRDISKVLLLADKALIYNRRRDYTILQLFSYVRFTRWITVKKLIN